VTIAEALAALNLAPADEKLSAVEPNMTRRDVVAIARSVIAAAPRTVIDVMPLFARHVASVLQDCTDPVELRFAYDQQGNITVGWNREEVEVRKGLRPRPGGAVPLKHLLMLRTIDKLFGQYAPYPKPAKPAPAQEPKPDKVDPSNPKFVLKRPKL
jgi:hypothetical protein